MIAGATLFGLIPLFVVWGDGIAPVTLVWGRALVASMVAGLALSAYRKPLGLSGKLLGHFTVWSLALCLAMVAYVYSIRLAGMAMAGTLMGLQPLAVAGFVWLLFREKIPMKVAAACGLAFLGVMLLSGSGPGGTNFQWGICAGIGSAALLGVNFTYHLKYLPDEHPWNLVFIQNLIQIPFLAPFLFIEESSWSLGGMLCLVALGVFCTFGAYTLIYLGSKSVGKHSIGILQLSENIIPIVAGVGLFGEDLGWKSWVGICLVVGSVLMVHLPLARRRATSLHN